MNLFVLFLISCKGCMSCWVMPPLPQPDNSEAQSDTGETEEEEDTAELDTGDTSDPPPYVGCTWPEDEPNNFVTAPNPLALEEWACGVLGTPFDNDYFTFETHSDSWLRVWLRGSEILTDADPRAFVLDERGEFTATLEDGYLTSDIDNTFKLDEARTMYIAVLEQNGLYGDDYEWELRVSVVKPPTTWTMDEAEPNDSTSAAVPIADGDRVFGRVEYISRYDYFTLNIEDEKSAVELEIEAYRFGSPLNAQLVVTDPSGAEVDRVSHNGSSPDPRISFTALDPGAYTVRVGACCEGDSSPSHVGLPYWYVLSTTVTPDDTVGAGIDTGE
jgi:hypothetical protein